MARVWTEAQRQYVRDNAHRMRDHELAAKLSLLTNTLVRMPEVRTLRRDVLGIVREEGGHGGIARYGPDEAQ